MHDVRCPSDDPDPEIESLRLILRLTLDRQGKRMQYALAVDPIPSMELREANRTISEIIDAIDALEEGDIGPAWSIFERSFPGPL